MSDQVFRILEKYGETDRSNVWTVQKSTIIKHAALERVAAKAGVKYLQPTVLRAERDEAVILVTGELDSRTEWSIGEAKVVPMIDSGKKNDWGKPVYEPVDGAIGNYQITPKQAAYVYAMAEKRAKDRVILKLIGLHGLAYSEDEADDFKASTPAAQEPKRDSAVPTNTPLPEGLEPKPAGADLLTKALILAVNKAATPDALKSWWASEETQANFKKISDTDLKRVKEAKAIRWAELMDGVPA
jgi:hypothetical protein